MRQVSDEVPAFAFRMWWRAWDSEQWAPGSRLWVHLDDGRGEVPAQLSWATEDGAQCTLGFSSDMTGCYGHRRSATGDLVELRGELDDQRNRPEDREVGRVYEFDTEAQDVGGWVPVGRLRLLVEDGSEAPAQWVAWHDWSGNASSVVLRAASPSGRADVSDLITAVRASAEHGGGGEVAANLVDAAPSKWFAPRNDATLEFQLSTPIALDRYVLTSANDAPDRDPAEWTLRGSADGQGWRILDTRAGQSFPGRHQSRTYRIAEPGACAHYRLEITGSNGSPHLQLQAVRFLAEIGGFVGYRIADAAAAYRGTRVAKGLPGVSGQPQPEGDGAPAKSGTRESSFSSSAPVTVEQWREYLRSYSAEVLAGEGWTEDQPAAGWLGCDPATEEEIAAAERRLGVRLPQAYRNFLSASNGWNHIGGLGGYPVDLLPVERIGWFAELEGKLLEAWSSPGLEFFAEELSRLKRCLLISNDDGGTGCYWLLHVDGAGQDGEPAAFEWFPGDGEDPEPYDGFTALATRGGTSGP